MGRGASLFPDRRKKVDVLNAIACLLAAFIGAVLGSKLAGERKENDDKNVLK
jgi:uncharacterized membrane protein YfcA